MFSVYFDHVIVAPGIDATGITTMDSTNACGSEWFSCDVWKQAWQMYPVTFGMLRQLLAEQKAEEEDGERKSETETETIPVPNLIVLKMVNGKGGRKAGNPNYCDEELLHLFRIMEDVLPTGSDDWDRTTSRHRVKYPSRDKVSIKRKFNDLHRKKEPTGCGEIPWDVERAKEIHRAIGDKNHLGFCSTSERYSLEKGHPRPFSGGYTTTPPPAVPPPAVPPPAAPPPAAGEAATNATPPAATPTGDSDETVSPTDTSSTVSGLPSTAPKRSYVKHKSGIDRILEKVNVVMLQNAEQQKNVNLALAEQQKIMNEQQMNMQKNMNEAMLRNAEQNQKLLSQSAEQNQKLIAALATTLGGAFQRRQLPIQRTIEPSIDRKNKKKRSKKRAKTGSKTRSGTCFLVNSSSESDSDSSSDSV